MILRALITLEVSVHLSAERRATCLRGHQTLRRNTWGIINIQLAKKECFNLAIIVEYMKYNVFFHHREMMKEALTQVLQQVTEKKQKTTTTET